MAVCRARRARCGKWSRPFRRACDAYGQVAGADGSPAHPAQRLRVRASAKTALVRLFLQRIAQRAPSIVGSPWSFLGLLATVIVWLALGAPFDYSGNWLLIPATVTSVGAVILVVLLQYTQNRDTRAIQLKLELIRSLQDARTHLVRLEQLSDDELDELEQEFRRLRETA